VIAALAVFLGGGLGALARWGLGLAVARTGLAGSPWPVATLCANLLGGLLIGMLTAMLVRHGADDPVRLFAITGVLGGFTTFSAFSLEVWRLLEAGNWPVALAYGLVSVLVAVAAVGLGLAFGQRLA
jgi:fluoride exporter